LRIFANFSALFVFVETYNTIVFEKKAFQK